MDDKSQAEVITEEYFEKVLDDSSEISSANRHRIEEALFSRAKVINRKYRERIRILQHKIFVNQKEKERYRLENGELKKRIEELELENLRLLDLSQNDGLTGIPNRRSLDGYLNKEWLRGRRESSILSVLIIDIDHFKEYNDHYGHVAGDQCIIGVANTLKKTLKRPGDFLGRYGGDEFIAILPNTDAVGARLMAEEMRKGIEDLRIIHQYNNMQNYVSITIGISTVLPDNHMASEDIVQMADDALYKAKENGRNQARAFSPQG